MAGFISSLFGSKPQALQPFDLSTPLLWFSKKDPWTIADACQGVQVFGETGSGKTTGSGAHLAKSFLSAGFGGLVLTAKPDERRLWESYCLETGRSDSLMIFSPEQPWRFNFLDYELRRPGRGAGETENLVNLFYTIMEMADRGQNYGKDPFWDRAVKQMLRNAIDVLRASRGGLLLSDLYDMLASAPLSLEEAAQEAWREKSPTFKNVDQGFQATMGTAAAGDFGQAARYWLQEFPAMAEKTRSIIMTSFTSMADCFLRGRLRELFCTTTNLVPEHSHQGQIILLDLPVKQYAEIGRYAQVLFKYIWQCATERRDVSANPRPVFLWADEAQFFLTGKDADFQTTARSSRACTVYLTQNLPNYYMQLAGDRGRHEVESLLGNLRTKIFHTNGDATTNKWASEMIAQSWTGRTSYGSTTGPQSSQNFNMSRSLEYRVLPEEFIGLRNGGPENRFEVDSIVFRSGKPWTGTGTHVIRPVFGQGVPR